MTRITNPAQPAVPPLPPASPVPAPEPPLPTAPPGAVVVTAAPVGIGDVWLRLADCESGEWDRHGHPIPGSRRWDYRGPKRYQGGVHFAPQTWDDFRPVDYPDHAGDATPEQQIEVARLVLAAQGAEAWPTCSKKVGLTRAAA